MPFFFFVQKYKKYWFPSAATWNLISPVISIKFCKTKGKHDSQSVTINTSWLWQTTSCLSFQSCEKLNYLTFRWQRYSEGEPGTSCWGSCQCLQSVLSLFLVGAGLGRESVTDSVCDFVESRTYLTAGSGKWPQVCISQRLRKETTCSQATGSTGEIIFCWTWAIHYQGNTKLNRCPVYAHQVAAIRVFLLNWRICCRHTGHCRIWWLNRVMFRFSVSYFMCNFNIFIFISQIQK